jgi:pyruvate dehydrogenase E2 component (dihydrolipoamide acetyltransferase)
VLVKVGDTVKAEDSLITLESDKATMDVPSPVSGVVREMKLKVGDKVAEGSTGRYDRSGRRRPPRRRRHRHLLRPPAAPCGSAGASAQLHQAASSVEVRVPDIGDFKDVPIIELLVKVGDRSRPKIR